MLLIAARLVLGEFAHAHPHEMSVDAVAAAQASGQQEHCPNHEKAAHEHAAGDSSSDIEMASDPHPAGADAQSSAEDCCKGGDCVCPCLHSPAVAAGVALSLQRINLGGAAAASNGALSTRPSVLFRPPA